MIGLPQDGPYCEEQETASLISLSRSRFGGEVHILGTQLRLKCLTGS